MPRGPLNRAAIRRATRARGLRVRARLLDRMEQCLVAFVAAHVARHLRHPHPRLAVTRVVAAADPEAAPVLVVGARRARPVRALGSGTYGQVIEYAVRGERVAVKVEPVKLPAAATETAAELLGTAAGRRRLATPDSEAARILDEALGGRSGGLLGIRYLGLHAHGATGAAHLYSMPIMDGSLGDLGALEMLIDRFRRPGDPSRTRPPVLRIVELVRRQAVLLLQLDRRLCYTDLKPSNVLYRLRDGGATEVWLCDFGSAMVDDEDEYTFTYPNPPSGRPFQRLGTLRERRAALAYQVGVLLATCIGIDTDGYLHDRCSIPLDTTPLQRELAKAYGPALATLVAPHPGSRRPVTRPLTE